MKRPIERPIQQGTYINEEQSEYLDELSKALNVSKSKAVERCIQYAMKRGYMRDILLVTAENIDTQLADFDKQEIEIRAKRAEAKAALEIVEAWQERSVPIPKAVRAVVKTRYIDRGPGQESEEQKFLRRIPHLLNENEIVAPELRKKLLAQAADYPELLDKLPNKQDADALRQMQERMQE